MNEKFSQLRAPFPLSCISWGKGFASRDGVSVQALPSVNPVKVKDRLDDVIGPADWCNSFVEVIANGRLVAVRAILKIRIGDEWVAKEDAAQFSAKEAQDRPESALKRAYTDAFKRAAAMWGVGRYLYGYTAEYVPLAEDGGLSVIPGLPACMLPEADAHLANQREIVAPAAAAAPGFEKGATQPPAENAEMTDKGSGQGASNSTKTTAPVESPAKEKAAASAQPEPPPSAKAGNPEFSLDSLPEDERHLVEGLLEKLEKPHVSPAVLRAYITGAKCRERAAESTREWLLTQVSLKEQALKDQAAKAA